jgi:hypothetical protein
MHAHHQSDFAQRQVIEIIIIQEQPVAGFDLSEGLRHGLFRGLTQSRVLDVVGLRYRG